MKHIWMLFFSLLATAMVACSSGRVVQSTAVQGFDLSDYRTFALAEPEGPHGLRAYQLAEGGGLLQRSVVQELESRGLRHNPTQPDLLVKLHVDVADKVQTRETNFVTDPPFYMGQRRYHWSTREVEVGRYKQSTVSVQLVDRYRDQVVWQGEGQRVLPKNIDRWEHAVAKGTEKVFSRL